METNTLGFAGDIRNEGADAVEILVNDHRVIKQLLTELPDATGQARADLLQRLKAILTIHNATEENFVYPAIHEIAGRPSTRAISTISRTRRRYCCGSSTRRSATTANSTAKPRSCAMPSSRTRNTRRTPSFPSCGKPPVRPTWPT